MRFLNLNILLIVLILVLSGCGVVAPKPLQKEKIDTALPVVSLTKNGKIVDMNGIAFEWKRLKDLKVDGIYVYKKKEDGEYLYDNAITNRFKTHYVDNNVVPDTTYSYYFQVYSKNAKGNKSKEYRLKTLPVLKSVSWIHGMSGMPRSVKILWRPHVNQRVESYIIERKTKDDEDWQEIANLKGRLNAEYIDENLKDNDIYLYRIKVKSFDDIISTPSKIVKALTKPLPKSVTGIKATKNLPKKIKITWNDSVNKDFYKYYLYRSDALDGNYELIAKLYNNIFIDKIDEDGKAYFYKVSVIDKDYLESEYDKNVVMGMTLSKPKPPLFVKAKLFDDRVELSWRSGDSRSRFFIVERKIRVGWFKEISQEFKGITSFKFIDKDLKPDSGYSYAIYSVDENNIKSEPSIEVSLRTPESKQILKPVKQENRVHVVKSTKNENNKKEVEIQPIKNLDLNEI